MNHPAVHHSNRIVALLFLAGFTAAPVTSADGPADERPAAAANSSAPAESLEEVAARLKKTEGAAVALRPSPAGSPFESRREIAVTFRNWDSMPRTLFVVSALPADRVGERPEDFRGASAVEVIATDSRYTVVAGSPCDPENANTILAALGLTLTKEAESRRLRHCAASWIDFRLAVARDSDLKPESPRPLVQGPTPAQIDDYTKLFHEKGYNGGRRRGDPHLWYPVLGCCAVAPALATTADRAASYVLLSDRPDEVLRSGSKRPRPWHLKRVQAVRDALGRPAAELEFDAAASARMARLIDDNPGRALALLFDDRVVQIQVIDGKWHDKLIVSGQAFDEKAVAGMVRSLRECMLDPAADRNSGSDAAPVELKAVEQALKPILEALDPKATIEYRDKSLVATSLAQTFKIHARTGKSGEFSEKVYDEIGPSSKGFVLRVQLEPRGEVHQAVTPQTIREPYWLTDLDVTPIAKTDKQVLWALSYGSRMDHEVLDRMRGKLKALKDAPDNR